jgi:N-acetylglucosaminyldiphosphoundecaprenol N-acetyl-beta-D-mannosaminyltransferase
MRAPTSLYRRRPATTGHKPQQNLTRYAQTLIEVYRMTLFVSSADIGEPPTKSAVRSSFLGVPIDCLTLSQTIAAVDLAIASRQTLQQVCLNVAKFVAMRRDPELDCDVRSSHIVSVDGMGIVWAARLFGVGVPERVAGVDLMEGVLALCQAKSYRPFFLGARPAVLQRAMANAEGQFPGLEFAGARHGYFMPEEEPAVVAEIRSSAADCLFIGMPTPRKERFLASHRDQLGVPFIMGVGGGLDVLAGYVRRAPLLIRQIGLEWLFRTAQEPRRLARRYLVTNAVFAAIIAKPLITRFFRENV